MKIFAQLDSNNLVTNLIPIDDVFVPNEASGIAYVQALFGNQTFVLAETNNPIPRRNTRIGSYFDTKTHQFYRPIVTNNPVAPSYINLPNGTSYCVIFRNASSLLTGLIKKTFFGPVKQTGQAVRNLYGIPVTPTPTGIAHAIIRNPVDRFVSAYALQTGGVPCWLGVDDFITWIGQQDPATINRHFRKQTLLVGDPPPEGITYHDFAKLDFNALATTFGLPTPVTIVNKTNPSKKPTLNPSQIDAIQSLYSEDVDLYSTISTVAAS